MRRRAAPVPAAPSPAASSPRSATPSRTGARQKRQFEERDRRIREVVQKLLIERGLHGFSMEDVAHEIEYSKGTVYLHYESKEDALVAACADSCGESAACIEAASRFPGRPRERMVAVAESYGRFVRDRAEEFRSIPTVLAPSVLELASPARLKAVDAAQSRCLGACSGIIKDAVKAGDLTLPRGMRAEDVSFSLWSLLFGTYTLAGLHAPKGLLGIKDPAAAVRLAWGIHMDGLGWRPTLDEWDYDATQRRIRAALFAQEDPDDRR